MNNIDKPILLITFLILLPLLYVEIHSIVLAKNITGSYFDCPEFVAYPLGDYGFAYIKIVGVVLLFDCVYCLWRL